MFCWYQYTNIEAATQKQMLDHYYDNEYKKQFGIDSSLLLLLEINE